MISSTYWKNRRKLEKQWQQQALKDDEAYNKRLKVFYDQAVADIDDTIERELNRVGRDAVSKMDVQRYQHEAESIVSEAEQLRKSGHKVVYSDFSDEVNLRLKVYNATMRINRLEHLKSEVGLDMLRAGVKVDASLRDRLAGEYQKQAIRQAGIMMDSAQKSHWTSSEMAKIVMAQTQGASFSKRLWADQDALKARLDQVLATGMIQGQNPRKMAKKLEDQVKKTVDNHRYVAERLARTESVRVQNTVAYDRIKSHGFKYVEWIAEAGACRHCQAIADKDSGHGKGVYLLSKLPRIPDDTHPNCRCGFGVADVPENFTEAKAEIKATKERGQKASQSFETRSRTKAKSRNDEAVLHTYFTDKFIKDFETKIGDRKHLAEIAKRLDKAPKNEQLMFAKYRDRFKLGKSVDVGSYFSPTSQETHFCIENLNFDNDPNYYMKQYDAFFHEFGHAIDHLAVDTVDSPEFDQVSTKLVKYIDSDFRKRLRAKAAKVYQLSDPAFQAKIVDGKYRMLDGTVLKFDKDGRPSIATMNVLGQKVAPLVISDIDQALKDGGYTTQEIGDLSDIVGACYQNNPFPFGVGHDADYWNTERRATEFFAEATSATVNNPRSRELLEKYFPSAIKQYDSIVSALAKGETP